MIKFYLTLVFYALYAGGLYAQNVGIGTAGPVAKLDINDGGYAVRERTAASANAITIPANTSTFRILPGGAATGTMALSATGVDGQRMVIVNDHATHAATFAGATVAAGGGTGNFVYIGGAWRYFGGFPTTSTAWNLTGNAGTNPTTNFLGTTDAQDLSIRAGASGRVRVYTDGRVLVGASTSMSNRLTVGGHNSALRLTGTGANESGATMYFGDGSDVSLQEDTDNTLRIDATGRTAIMGGNVGIKTTSPIQDLDVNGRMNVANGVIQRGGTAITTTSELGLYSRLNGNSIRFVSNQGPLRFFTDGDVDPIGSAERMIILANGNVGIGMATPNLRLDVLGGYGSRESSAAPTALGISIPNNVSTFRILNGGVGSGAIAVTATGFDGQRLVIFNQHATRQATFAGVTIAAAGGTGNFVFIDNAWRYFGGSPSSTAWNITGNNGTTPAANYLGTIDDQGLSIRSFATERMRIHRIGATSTASVWVNAVSPFPSDDVFSSNANAVDGLSGVAGYNLVTTGTTISAGVFGMANRAAAAAGVQGENAANVGTGVRGFGNTGGTGVEGYSPGTDGFGIWGLADAGTTAATGGVGVNGFTGAAGLALRGSGGSFSTDKALAQTAGAFGVYAGNTALCIGVQGYNNRSTGNQNIGVLGNYNTAAYGVGVHGISYTGGFVPATNVDYAVVGSGGNYAGYFTTGLTTNAAVLGGVGITSFVAGSGGAFASNVAASCGLLGVTTGTGTSVGVRGQGVASGAAVLGGNGVSVIFAGAGGTFSSNVNSGAAAYGYSSGANAADGLIGIATGTGTGANACFGVIGEGPQQGVGVAGVNGTNINFVAGTGGSFSSERNIAGGQYPGLFGAYNGTTALCFGVQGYNGRATGNQNIGVVGMYNGASAFGIGVYGIGAGGGYIVGNNDVAVVGWRANNANYSGYFNGNHAIANGTKSASVPTTRGNQLLYCMESPEVWFEDFGTATLVNGQIHVELDDLFRQTTVIDDAHPMHVFVQAQGECNDLYVVPGTSGFTVKEKNGGQSNVRFSYRVVAKRVHFQDHRFGNDPVWGPGDTREFSQYAEPPALDYHERVAQVERHKREWKPTPMPAGFVYAMPPNASSRPLKAGNASFLDEVKAEPVYVNPNNVRENRLPENVFQLDQKLNIRGTDLYRTVKLSPDSDR